MRVQAFSLALLGPTVSLATSLSKRALAPASGLPDGWKYISCFGDDLVKRTLTDAYTANDAMTGEACVKFCGSQGYPIAATEYSSQCFCGIETAGFLEYPNACNMPCAGNSSQACGGPVRLSVYSNGLPGPVTNPGDVGNFAHMGCWPDSVSDRVLPHGVEVTGGSTAMTVAKCAATCRARGYDHAGLEYAGECFCGSQPSSAQVDGIPQISGCKMACKGNVSEYCGGSARINVYYLPPLVLPDPTSKSQKPSVTILSASSKSTTNTTHRTTATTKASSAPKPTVTKTKTATKGSTRLSTSSRTTTRSRTSSKPTTSSSPISLSSSSKTVSSKSSVSTVSSTSTRIQPSATSRSVTPTSRTRTEPRTSQPSTSFIIRTTSSQPKSSTSLTSSSSSRTTAATSSTSSSSKANTNESKTSPVTSRTRASTTTLTRSSATASKTARTSSQASKTTSRVTHIRVATNAPSAAPLQIINNGGFEDAQDGIAWGVPGYWHLADNPSNPESRHLSGWSTPTDDAHSGKRAWVIQDLTREDEELVAPFARSLCLNQSANYPYAGLYNISAYIGRTSYSDFKEDQGKQGVSMDDMYFEILFDEFKLLDGDVCNPAQKECTVKSLEGNLTYTFETTTVPIARNAVGNHSLTICVTYVGKEAYVSDAFLVDDVSVIGPL